MRTKGCGQGLFCDKCGALLLPKINQKGKSTLHCAVCGFARAARPDEGYTLQQKIAHSECDETIVVDEPEALEQLPLAKIACPKCEYKQTSYWQRLVHAQDADSTLFYRCRDCGHTWRDTS